MNIVQDRGYRMIPKNVCQDLDHALVALRGLGRYHGMAKVLEERGIICKDNYGGPFMMTNKNMVKCFIYGAIRKTAKIVQEAWNPTW